MSSSTPISLLLFTLTLFLSSVVGDKCFPGWFSHGGRCYGLADNVVTWADAQVYCAMYRANLAEVETTEENEYLKQLAGGRSYVDAVWIGGTDIFNNGHWDWVHSMEPIQGFSDWAPGEPNTAGQPGEDCLQLLKKLNFQWNDERCDRLAYFICEADPLPDYIEGWIVFQRRVNGEVDFYRGWEEYKKGFGNFEDGDFWLGNEIIYQLTSNGEWELRVDIAVQLNYIANLDYALNNGKLHTFYALYSNFSLAGEDDNYRLTLGGYSGTAGDSLAWYHNGMEFSTRDRDNDKYAYQHCARTGHGAWWYNECNYSNLNGLWGNNTDGRGLRWSTRTYSQTSKSTLMKMRPVS